MSYEVWIEPDALTEARSTPGNARQRIKRAMQGLAQNPRPSGSRPLDWPAANFEPRRLKLDNWRIIYAVNDTGQWVWVLAIRKRPPYDYGDLAGLLRRVE